MCSVPWETDCSFSQTFPYTSYVGSVAQRQKPEAAARGAFDPLH